MIKSIGGKLPAGGPRRYRPHHRSEIVRLAGAAPRADTGTWLHDCGAAALPRELCGWRSVLMPVVNVGKVRVRVAHRLVRVLVGVRLEPLPFLPVLVPVMLVVAVRVGMRERLVRVRVLVALRRVQPHAEEHQESGGPECEAGGLAEQPHREGCADER